MTRRGALVAAALVALVNAFVLARVALNRRASGPALTLTERELPVAWVSPREESSEVALRLDVGHWLPWTGLRGEDLDPLRWLDAAKRAELGFDVALPQDQEEAQRFVHRQLSRDAYALVEYDGPACAEYRKGLAAAFGVTDPDLASVPAEPVVGYDARSLAERELRFGSRLFVVDVARDAATLRGRHPDRSADLIVPVKVSADYAGSAAHPPLRLRGSVSLLIPEVNVPRPLQASLPSGGGVRYRYAEEQHHAPRYEVVLRSGARHEPWIEAIRPLSR
jgi:hypothetical protein